MATERPPKKETSTDRMQDFLKQKAEHSDLAPVGFDLIDLDLFDDMEIPFEAVMLAGKAHKEKLAEKNSSRLKWIAVAALVGLVIYAKTYQFLQSGVTDLRQHYGLSEDGTEIDSEATGFKGMVQDTWMFLKGMFVNPEGTTSADTEVAISTMPMSVPTDVGVEEFRRPADSKITPRYRVDRPTAQRAVEAATSTYQTPDRRVAETRDAIAYASSVTGVPQSTLLAVANKESRLGKFTSSGTSNATGPFQLMPGTFADIAKRHRRQFPILSSGINNVRAAAVASALYLRDAATSHESRKGRTALPTEQYVYYLMGHGGGRAFLERLESTPNRIAALDWPAAAKANMSVFFDVRSGRVPRSYKQIYEYLVAEVGVVAALFEERLNRKTVVQTETVPPVITTPPSINKTVAPVEKLSADKPASVKPALVTAAFPTFTATPKTPPASTDVVENRNDPGSAEGSSRKKLPQNLIRGGQGMVYATAE